MGLVRLRWRGPIEVMVPFAEEPWAVLLFGAAGGRRSFIALNPVAGLEGRPVEPDPRTARLAPSAT